MIDQVNVSYDVFGNRVEEDVTKNGTVLIQSPLPMNEGGPYAMCSLIYPFGRSLLLAPLLVLFLGIGGCGSNMVDDNIPTTVTEGKQTKNWEQKSVADLIKQLGGRVFVDTKYVSFPVVSIELNDAQFPGEKLALLQKLPQLNSLSLARSSVTDDDLKHLARCQNLKRLWLNGTKVSDAGLVHVAKLGNLEDLYLEGTLVTKTGTNEFIKKGVHVHK